MSLQSNAITGVDPLNSILFQNFLPKREVKGGIPLHSHF
ncbi:hypothetical protein LEP1GSC047_0248 [Leptospira inadai serovar Lyme str. 10]|uniref:Uncharacterized protein n=1 Tax=Leptospira inadai serovar Lyme str. 10 TaxID=1049790 RepID=V6HBI2_9LEPT|nr:hypothetical protein LEP1GSC047_0248 [Leptospira inadai serovar Lyme str. 10]